MSRCMKDDTSRARAIPGVVSNPKDGAEIKPIAGCQSAQHEKKEGGPLAPFLASASKNQGT